MFAQGAADAAEEMLNDVVTALRLELAPNKVKFLAGKHPCYEQNPVLKLGDNYIKKIDKIKGLGSMHFSNASEKGTYEHRIAAGWACYHKWQHVLECRATIKARMSIFEKTVARSLICGLPTTRFEAHNNAKLLSAPKIIVRKMLKIKRQPIATFGTKILEPWIDWQKRSISKAGQVIRDSNCDIVNLLAEDRLSWSQHIARMGTQERPSHALKATPLFRNVAWWRRQQAFNALDQSPMLHRPKMGKICRWESQLHKKFIFNNSLHSPLLGFSWQVLPGMLHASETEPCHAAPGTM